MSTTQPVKEHSRVEVWKMFDRIAPRYDLLNRLLSMRQDVAWRRKMATHVQAGEHLRLLDLATGTGDQLLAMVKHCPRITSGVGLDMAEKMLEHGRPKLAARELDDRFELRRGDAADLSGEPAGYDIATMSFGIRNVPDVPSTLRQVLSLLNPGGRFLVLEFSLPSNALLRRFYLFYFRHILPRIGGALSGDSFAYRYLNETVETFPYGDAFCALMSDAGYVDVKAHPLTLGIATIYVGNKAAG